MTPEEFVASIRVRVYEPAAEGCITLYRKPPGRKAAQPLVELSEWFVSLSEHDQTMVRKVARDVSRAAVFQFFCVLDGVSAIEDRPDKGDLSLLYVRDGREWQLNNQGEFLHDIFNADFFE